MNLIINNLEWHIRLESPEFIKEQAENKDLYYLGLTDYKSLTVYINNQIPKDLVVCTVLHELILAYIFSLGFDQFTEENMCKFMASHAKTLIKIGDKVADGLSKEICGELFVKGINRMGEYIKEINSGGSSDS